MTVTDRCDRQIVPEKKKAACMGHNWHRMAKTGTCACLLILLLFDVSCAAARTYRGVVLDEATGKPIEEAKVYCHGEVLDHGLGNWIRYKIVGGDFADTDGMVLDAAVTGPDGSFKLVIAEGRPYGTISVKKYGAFNYNTVLSDNMVIRMEDRPLRNTEGVTTTYRDAVPDADVARVLFATHTRGNDTIYCLNSASGEYLWQDRFFWDASAPVITVGERAFVGTEAGFVFAYSIETGERLWTYQTHQDVKQIGNDASNLYVIGGPGSEEILAINQVTGRITRRIDTDATLNGFSVSAGRLVAWSDRAVELFALPLRQVKSLPTRTVMVVPHSDAVYIVERNMEQREGTCLLSARSWEDLTLLWQCSLPREQFWRCCFVLHGQNIICIIGSSNIGGNVRARVCAFNADSGRFLWTYETPMQLSARCILVPKPCDRLFLLTEVQNKALCLSAVSGEVTWTKDVGDVHVGHTPVMVTHQPLVLGRGFIECVNPADGESVWSYPAGLRGDVVGLPTTTRSSVFVVGGTRGDGASVVRLSADDGLPVWRFTVPGAIRAPITCVPR